MPAFWAVDICADPLAFPHSGQAASQPFTHLIAGQDTKQHSLFTSPPRGEVGEDRKIRAG
jgi:hypothetical protein